MPKKRKNSEASEDASDAAADGEDSSSVTTVYSLRKNKLRCQSDAERRATEILPPEGTSQVNDNDSALGDQASNTQNSNDTSTATPTPIVVTSPEGLALDTLNSK